MTLERRLRLRSSTDFAKLRANGETFRHPLLILNYAENALPHNRYGVVTGKRLGNAVMRNRLRRRFKEAIREQHDAIIPGYDLALIVRAGAVTANYAAIVEALAQTLRRAGLLRS